MSKITLGNRIRWHRKRYGLTQRQLAKKASVSPGYLHQMETGSDPSATKLFGVAQALLLTMEYLLTGKYPGTDGDVVEKFTTPEDWRADLERRLADPRVQAAKTRKKLKS